MKQVIVLRDNNKNTADHPLHVPLPGTLRRIKRIITVSAGGAEWPLPPTHWPQWSHTVELIGKLARTPDVTYIYISRSITSVDEWTRTNLN